MKTESDTYFSFIAPPDVTINSLREEFKGQFYNQDWYIHEEFANRPLDGKHHRISLTVSDVFRGLDLKEDDPFLIHKLPSAGVYTYAFFAYWTKTGKRLWEYDYTWTSDVDSHGDPIYVGGYSLNKPGFEIHRHLSLRRCHSVALEL